MADIEAESAATIEDRYTTIRKVYYGKDGGSTAYKTYLDAKAIDPRITLDWVRGWVERTRQVGGAKHSYVAPHAFFEDQADLFPLRTHSSQIKTIPQVCP